MTEQPKAICAITDIPGLNVSNSSDLLKTYGITHVLSLTNLKYRPYLDKSLSIEHLHFPIDDNPYEDLLMALEGLCLWVTNSLKHSDHAKVLVHCIEGISRSGAIVVAMLMRTQSLDYDAALQLARTSRQVIAPNGGFTEQLRVWAGMQYSILEIDSSGAWKEKEEYEKWRVNRGILLSKDEVTKQDLRRKEMADMVVNLRRHEFAS